MKQSTPVDEFGVGKYISLNKSMSKEVKTNIWYDIPQRAYLRFF